MSTTKEHLPIIDDQGQNQNLAPINKQPGPDLSVFANMQSFQNAQRMATLLASSSLVPVDYQNNIANTTIALEMAQRIGASPLAVMQNLVVIYGKPTWSAQFIIASLNSSNRFSPLRFELLGTGQEATCYAWAYDLQNNNECIKGPIVSIAMAMAEGWYQKKGSKWQTMPEIMLRYRSASFFGKLYAPEIFMGMQTAEEMEDIIDVTTTPNEGKNRIKDVTDTGVKGVKQKLKIKGKENQNSNQNNKHVSEQNSDILIEEELIRTGPESNSLVIKYDPETGEVIPLLPGDIGYKADEKPKTKERSVKHINTKNANSDQF